MSQSIKKLKYFLDTEFIEDGITIDLISIGIACEDGRSFYRQNVECDFKKASDWVWRNVFPHLEHFDMRGGKSCTGMPNPLDLGNAKLSHCGKECLWRKRHEIRDELRDFLSIEKYGKPEFWGYFADYDWVAFCQLFGTMMELPKGFPMYCNDIKQLCNSVGDPKLPKDPDAVHNALADALWNKKAYEYLTP